MGAGFAAAPENAVIEFREVRNRAGENGIQLWRDGKALTTPLFDHPGVVAGLRYVEVFHLAHAVVLGWSPNTGRFLATDVQHDDSAESGDVGLEYAISRLRSPTRPPRPGIWRRRRSLIRTLRRRLLPSPRLRLHSSLRLTGNEQPVRGSMPGGS